VKHLDGKIVSLKWEGAQPRCHPLYINLDSVVAIEAMEIEGESEK